MRPVLEHRRPFLPARRVRGFGLVQSVLLLLLVSGALAAAAILLQSRRGAEQTHTQEASLRWAEEALTAFATANSRLPCPAATLNGPEDCGSSRAQGWLPVSSLVGASGSAPGIGPLHYAVYRGDATAFLDLTHTGNAYQPKDLSGDPRKYKKTVNGKEEDATYDDINGLDFCQSLGLASIAVSGTTQATTYDRSGLPTNIAYGLAAAGATPAAGGRFDGSNGGPSASLESPWRAGDSEYDDRVRVLSFGELAHAVGCRQISDTAVNITPYNVSTASLDALAATLTVHDSVGDLQQNNIGNAEAAVRDAGFAQAMAAAQVLLAAGHIADTVSSNILAVTELIRAIGTCIASLGTTCWEVPLKASAIAVEVASIISYGVALGVNIGTVAAAAVALNKTIDVQQRANAAVSPPASSPEEAAKKVCVAAHGGIVDEIVEVKRDADGNIVWKYGPDGKQLFDENGNPLYESEVKKNVWQDGLEQKMNQAQEVFVELRKHAGDPGKPNPSVDNGIYGRRIFPFSDGQISARIDVNKSWDLYFENNKYRYRMDVCEAKSGGEKTYSNGNCIIVKDKDDKIVPGGYEWVAKFNWTLAISDAIAKRQAAEAWSDANRAKSEADENFKTLDKNYVEWKDTLLPAMISNKNDDCAKASSGSAEQREKYTQVCKNDQAAITYTQTCKKTETVEQPDGSKVPQIVTDTDPDASCLPQLKKKRDDAETVKNSAAATVSSRLNAYNALKSPYLNYPSDWAYWMLVEDGKTPLGNPRYVWKQNPSQLVWVGPSLSDYQNKVPPFYYVDEHELLRTNTSVPIITCIFGIDPWKNGTQCERYPYSRAYNDYTNAKIAADEAENNYKQLQVQYAMMSKRCDDLKAIVASGPDGADFKNLAIGAEAILQLADRLGSVGEQTAGGNP